MINHHRVEACPFCRPLAEHHAIVRLAHRKLAIQLHRMLGHGVDFAVCPHAICHETRRLLDPPKVTARPYGG